MLTNLSSDILHETGCSMCGRHHFGRPQPGETNQYFRLAYSGIGREEITEGLGKFKAWMES